MSNDGATLRITDLGVHYGPRTVLTDVSFGVGAGEVVAVIGPNGAGKSSMFRAVVGLIRHDGVVALGGHPCHHRDHRLGLAYIPQDLSLDRDFPVSVRQVVAMGRRRFGRSIGRRRATDQESIREAIARVGLIGFEDRSIRELSGGEFQRTLLARALAQEASVLLLDEALSGVDQPRTQELLDLFHGLAADGMTLLVATHDLALARKRFDRVLAINGRLVADGPPATALSDTNLDATFGSAAVASGDHR